MRVVSNKCKECFGEYLFALCQHCKHTFMDEVFISSADYFNNHFNIYSVILNLVGKAIAKGKFYLYILKILISPVSRSFSNLKMVLPGC